MSAREHLSDQHLNENVILDAVYGITSQQSEEHLRTCPDCAGRVNEWKHRQASAIGTGELSNEFLAAQRREIYQRLSEKPSRVRLWAPVLAAACALTVGVFVYGPGAKPQRVASTEVIASAEVNDSQLFTDVFSMEQSLEPSAAASVRVLFEEQQQ